jgi:hypothetical protein
MQAVQHHLTKNRANFRAKIRNFRVNKGNFRAKLGIL